LFADYTSSISSEFALTAYFVVLLRQFLKSYIGLDMANKVKLVAGVEVPKRQAGSPSRDGDTCSAPDLKHPMTLASQQK
jgi:hypothetical protein